MSFQGIIKLTLGDKVLGKLNMELLYSSEMYRVHKSFLYHNTLITVGVVRIVRFLSLN